MQKKQQTVRGQSLVESVVTLGVVILLVTGLVIGTTAALKYAQSSKSRSSATQYASEGLELARKERDSGWTAFAKSGTFCVGAAGVIPTDPCTQIDGKYTRTLVYTYNETTKSVIVVSKISWIEGDEEKVTSLQTTLTNWK